jgi:hypothetical protein
MRGQVSQGLGTVVFPVDLTGGGQGLPQQAFRQVRGQIGQDIGASGFFLDLPDVVQGLPQNLLLLRHWQVRSQTHLVSPVGRTTPRPLPHSTTLRALSSTPCHILNSHPLPIPPRLSMALGKQAHRGGRRERAGSGGPGIL